MKKLFIAVISALMLFTTVSLNTVKAEENDSNGVVPTVALGYIEDEQGRGRWTLVYPEYDESNSSSIIDVHEYPGRGTNYFVYVTEPTDKEPGHILLTLNGVDIKFYDECGLILDGYHYSYFNGNKEALNDYNVTINLIGNNRIKYVESNLRKKGYFTIGMGLLQSMYGELDKRGYSDNMNVTLCGSGTLNIDLSNSDALGNYGIMVGTQYSNLIIMYSPIININLKNECIGWRLNLNSNDTEPNIKLIAAGNVGIGYGSFTMLGGLVNIDAYENRATVGGLVDMSYLFTGSDNRNERPYSQTNIAGGYLNINLVKPEGKLMREDLPLFVGGINTISGEINIAGGNTTINVDDFASNGVFGIDSGILAVVNFILPVQESKAAVAEQAQAVDAQWLEAKAVDTQLFEAKAEVGVDNVIPEEKIENIEEGNDFTLKLTAPLKEAANLETTSNDIYYDADRIADEYGIYGKVNILGGNIVLNINQEDIKENGGYAYGGIVALSPIKLNNIESTTIIGIHSAISEYLLNSEANEDTYLVSNYLADALDNVVTTFAIKGNAADPEPSKKDESCEAKLGPTWHWNNDKKVCEEVSVVGTATR